MQQDCIELILKHGLEDKEDLKWFLERSFWSEFGRRTLTIKMPVAEEEQEQPAPAPWEVLKQVLVKALERHPEARDEVVAALEGLSQ